MKRPVVLVGVLAWMSLVQAGCHSLEKLNAEAQPERPATAPAAANAGKFFKTTPPPPVRKDLFKVTVKSKAAATGPGADSGATVMTTLPPNFQALLQSGAYMEVSAPLVLQFTYGSDKYAQVLITPYPNDNNHLARFTYTEEQDATTSAWSRCFYLHEGGAYVVDALPYTSNTPLNDTSWVRPRIKTTRVDVVGVGSKFLVQVDSTTDRVYRVADRHNINNNEALTKDVTFADAVLETVNNVTYSIVTVKGDVPSTNPASEPDAGQRSIGRFYDDVLAIARSLNMPAPAPR